MSLAVWQSQSDSSEGGYGWGDYLPVPAKACPLSDGESLYSMSAKYLGTDSSPSLQNQYDEPTLDALASLRCSGGSARRMQAAVAEARAEAEASAEARVERAERRRSRSSVVGEPEKLATSSDYRLGANPSLGVIDWNQQFNQLAEEFRAASFSTMKSYSELVSLKPIFKRLSRLYNDFDTHCEMYGRIIISESPLPAAQKTLKPVDVGGFAGGDKYIVRNIFFKYADARSEAGKRLYPNDECAMKVAGHELRALVALHAACLTLSLPIHFPLMCLVDYKGFRIICQSILPISRRETVIYGSTDGGRTVYDGTNVPLPRSPDPSIKTFADVMRLLGSHLNLKAHRPRGSDDMLLSGPIDIEGHLGLDGRFYLLDVARLFPPKYFDAGTYRQGCNLWNVLRPELVHAFPTPLSSDALSNFQHQGDRVVNDREVRDATLFLCSVVIPRFARRLENQLSWKLIKHSSTTTALGSAYGSMPSHHQGQTASGVLCSLMHSDGINLKYLGRVRALMTQPQFRLLILLEILARSIKNNVRYLLRESLVHGESAQNHIVLRTLRSVLGTHKDSGAFWSSLKQECEQRFPGGLAASELHPEYDLRDSLSVDLPDGMGSTRDQSLRSLVQRVQHICGLRLSFSTFNELMDKPLSGFEYTSADLRGYVANFKSQMYPSLATAVVLHTKAQKHLGSPGSDRLLNLAVRKFQEALQRQPNSILAGRAYAVSLQMTSTQKTGLQRIQLLGTALDLISHVGSSADLLAFTQRLHEEYGATARVMLTGESISSRDLLDTRAREALLITALKGYRALLMDPLSPNLKEETSNRPFLLYTMAELLKLGYSCTRNPNLLDETASIYHHLRSCPCPEEVSTSEEISTPKDISTPEQRLIGLLHLLPQQLFTESPNLLSFLGAIEMLLTSPTLRPTGEPPRFHLDIDSSKLIFFTSDGIQRLQRLAVPYVIDKLALNHRDLDDLGSSVVQGLLAHLSPTAQLLSLTNYLQASLDDLSSSDFPASLTHLDLSGSHTISPSIIASLIHASASTLQRLDLRRVSLAGAEVHQAIAQCIHLQHLDLGRTGPFLPPSVLAAALSPLQNLLFLNLATTAVDSCCLDAIAPILPRLEFLDLSDCPLLTARDLQHLSDLLKSNVLRSLRLANLRADDLSLYRISLQTHALSSLDLSGVAALTESTLRLFCSRNPRLTSLHLMGCSLLSSHIFSEVLPSLLLLQSFSSSRLSVAQRPGQLEDMPAVMTARHRFPPPEWHFVPLPFAAGSLVTELVIPSTGLLNDAILCETLAGLPRLRTLVVDFCHSLTDATLAALEKYSHLKALSVRECLRMTDRGFMSLFKRVLIRKLHLAGTQAGDPSIRVLSHYSLLMTRLDISRCERLTDQALHFLGKRCLKLKRIYISGCAFSDDGLRALLDRCLSLSHIHVQQCYRISSFSLSLAKLASLKSLVFLNMSFTNVSDRSLVPDASSPPVRLPSGLSFLSIRRCAHLTTASLELLSSHPPPLRSLIVSNPELTPESLLSTVPKFPFLQVLDVSNSALEDSQFAVLFSSLPHLTEFRSRHCPGLNTSLLILLQLCPRIHSLDLTDCTGLTNESFASLAPRTSQLQTLRIQGCTGITPQGFFAVTGTAGCNIRLLEAGGIDCFHFPYVNFLHSHSIANITGYSPRSRSRTQSRPDIRSTSTTIQHPKNELASSLRYLSLAHSHNLDIATCQGLLHRLTHLETLVLDFSDVTTECLAVIADLCPNLKHVSLVGCRHIAGFAPLGLCYKSVFLHSFDLSLCPSIPFECMDRLINDFPHIKVVGTEEPPKTT